MWTLFILVLLVYSLCNFFLITDLTVSVDTVVYPFSIISSEDSIEDLAAPKTGNVISSTPIKVHTIYHQAILYTFTIQLHVHTYSCTMYVRSVHTLGFICTWSGSH